MKNKTKLIFIFLLCFVHISPAVAQELSRDDVKKLLPDYFSMLVSKHERIITGEERSMINEVYVALDPDNLGRNGNITLSYINELAKKLVQLRQPANHKESLRKEVKIISNIIQNNPAEINCLYSKPTTVFPAQGTVKCDVSHKLEDGCFYKGNFGILVNPLTKRAINAYRSTIDSKAAYYFGRMCAD